MLFLFLAADAAALAVTLFFIVKHKKARGQGALASLAEAPVTGFLGFFAVAIGLFLPLAVITSPNALYDDSTVLVIGGFSLVIILTACFTFLYTYVKKLEIYEDELVRVSPLGQRQATRWSEIRELEVPFMRKKLVLKTSGGSCSIAGGNPKSLKPFLEELQLHLPSDIGRNALLELLARL